MVGGRRQGVDECNWAEESDEHQVSSSNGDATGLQIRFVGFAHAEMSAHYFAANYTRIRCNRTAIPRDQRGELNRLPGIEKDAVYFDSRLYFLDDSAHCALLRGDTQHISIGTEVVRQVPPVVAFIYRHIAGVPHLYADEPNIGGSLAAVIDSELILKRIIHADYRRIQRNISGQFFALGLRAGGKYRGDTNE
jgi:hypothetical protein